MINIMIAEDNIELNKQYSNILSKENYINSIFSTFNGEDTITNYFKLEPDILILDLNIPQINGIDVINTIGKLSGEKKKCNIIVVSGSIEHLNKLYNTAQVYKVIPKPTKIENIIDTIKEMSIPIKELDQKKLKLLLLELGINIFSSKGRQLIKAISIAFNQPYLLENIKDLYSEVGKQYSISPLTVKWSIRSLIDTLNRSLSINDLCSFFSLNFKPETISPKFFISLVVEYFK